MAEGAAGWETFRDESFDEVPLLIEPPPPPPLAREVEEVGSLEELLDQGESLLQEYRSGSPTLIDRLCTPQNVCVLVDHATKQPSEGVPPDKARLRSHTAWSPANQLFGCKAVRFGEAECTEHSAGSSLQCPAHQAP
ncbi:unnamed protein product [Symbiodinium sp. CCMP2592]|nr:unnamed protein product [Symbiodinium sp. CCMP2592]